MRLLQGLLLTLAVVCGSVGAATYSTGTPGDDASAWHSGNTDSNGCHYNRKTNTYHCH